MRNTRAALAVLVLACVLRSSVPARSDTTPTVQDDLASTNVGTAVTINVLANDHVDLVAASWTQPTNGSVSAAASGTALVYTPNPSFIGQDTFVYTVTDRGGAKLSATVTVTVVDFAQPTLPGFACGPSAEFCNSTDAAGLGADVRYGRGAAFADVDGDGWDDLFTADADERLRPTFGVSRLYLNNGNGTFRAADVGISPDDLVATWGAAFADYDNDGDPDVLIVNGGYAESSLAFYENRMNVDGTFVRATSTSRIDVANGAPSRWWGASWADYDNDGFLDVIVTRTVGPPLLFHNNGDKTFTEVGAAMGLDVVFGATDDGKNPVWLDYNTDGFPDLYIAGLQKHVFYENVGGHRFVDVTSHVFDAPWPANTPEFSPTSPVVFSAVAEDFNQDGRDDLYLGRWNQQDLLMINDGAGHLRPLGQEAGLDDATTRPTDFNRPFENTMGLGVGDLFDEGYPDVYLGTGNQERAARDIFFCNDGTRFSRCTDRLLASALSEYRTRGRGAAFADVNHDGTTDVFLNLGGHEDYDVATGRDTREKGALLVRQPTGLARTATITLEGTKSNRDAIGARVRLDGTVVHHYVVRSAQGLQSQNSRALVVGLGDASFARVAVTWPSGGTSSLSIGAGNRVHVMEGAAATETTPEICGNCIDDDGDGLTDFEDPECCRPSTMTFRRVVLRPRHGSGSRLTLSTIVAGLKLERVTPGTSVSLQFRPADGAELICASIPPAAIKRTRHTFRLNTRHTPAGAAGLTEIVLQGRHGGGVQLVAKGPRLGFPSPTPGRFQLTLGFRDPASAEAGNRCATANERFRDGGRKGGVRFP